MDPFKVLIAPGVLPSAELSDLRRLLAGAPVAAAESIRAAVHELDQMAVREAPSSFAVLVIALEDLGREPGSVQSHLALHQQQQRVILIATYQGAQSPSTLAYPVRVDVLTRPPFKSEDLAQHIDDAVKKHQGRTALRRAGDVLNGIGASILVVTPEGIITWANDISVELLGVDSERLIGEHLAVLLSPEPRAKAVHRLEQQIRALRPDFTVELGDFVVARSMLRRVRISCTARRSQAKERDEIVLLLHDISTQHEQYAENLLSAKVFEHSGEAIMITDHEDRILKVNSGFTQLTGYPALDVIGRLPSFLNAGREPPAFHGDLWAQVHAEGHWKGELWHRRKNGEPYAAWCAISAVRDSEGEIDHYISIFTDVTERKLHDERRLYQSQLDLLTGLPNRVLLADRFAQIVARHARQPVRVAILFIDLDGFKPINDEHGHFVGDELLRIVAERLSASVRASDTVSRYGGDEFVCLLDDLDEADAPQKVAVTILKALASPITVAGHSLSISASIGISIFGGTRPDLSVMMSRADDAMYHAKRAGRGRWHVAPEDSP